MVVPGFERLVLLRTARLVASLGRPATTAVAACATAVGVGQLVGWLAAVVRPQGLSVACSVCVCTLLTSNRIPSL